MLIMLERNLIIPDLPNEYILDTDAFDSIYINQRYIIDAISQADKTNVTLFLYDNDEIPKNYYKGRTIKNKGNKNK